MCFNNSYKVATIINNFFKINSHSFSTLNIIAILYVITNLKKKTNIVKSILFIFVRFFFFYRDIVILRMDRDYSWSFDFIANCGDNRLLYSEMEEKATRTRTF